MLKIKPIVTDIYIYEEEVYLAHALIEYNKQLTAETVVNTRDILTGSEDIIFTEKLVCYVLQSAKIVLLSAGDEQSFQ